MVDVVFGETGCGIDDTTVSCDSFLYVKQGLSAILQADRLDKEIRK